MTSPVAHAVVRRTGWSTLFVTQRTSTIGFQRIPTCREIRHTTATQQQEQQQQHRLWQHQYPRLTINSLSLSPPLQRPVFIMAADEARALLDSLFGGDRNARLPPGTAQPRKKRKHGGAANAPLLLPNQKTRSCYDHDADPLYCEWGVDVYELFVNTKSDLGPNPNTPDDGAREEYLALPQHEKDRLGFAGMLFSKLSDLVRGCDRTVSRNRDKLSQEASNKSMTRREGRDFVQDIDDRAVEQLAKTMLQAENLEKEIETVLEAFEKQSKTREDLLKEKAEKEGTHTTVAVKTEEEEGVKKEKADEPMADATKQEETTLGSTIVKAEEDDTGPDKSTTASNGKTKETNSALEKAIDEATYERQRSLFQLARKIQQLAPLQDSIEQQRKQLHYVKSDITSDKTVCEVSGNFMSARDADERIAAHYAGKQYVGWKLVRDKLKELQAKYGRYGPPRGPGRPSPAQQSSSHGRYDDSRRGGHDRDRRGGGGGSGGGGFRGGGGSGGDRGGYDRRGGGGRGGGRGYDRGGGGYNRGGSGYGGGGRDRDRRWQ